MTGKDLSIVPRIALYARVSKAEDQETENQLIQLRQWAAASGTNVEGEYQEAVSTRDTRPVKEELLRKMRLGYIDGVAFVALDRWGRNVEELAREMRELAALGKTLISLKEGLRFDSAAGQLYAHMLAAFAQFERDRIRERVMAGLARAKARGKKLGWPKGKKRGPLPESRGGHATGEDSPPMAGVIDQTNVFKVT